MSQEAELGKYAFTALQTNQCYRPLTTQNSETSVLQGWYMVLSVIELKEVKWLSSLQLQRAEIS